MRNSQNWQSTRTKIKSRKTIDLITSSQATLNTQESSLNYTQAGKRTNYTNTTSQKENDDFEDIIQEEISSLFITPQQEVTIKNVLELVSKHKITPSNAFQIPIKIIDPSLTNSTNMRFWKFASELLQASMVIYQKRVDNVQIVAHKMTNELIRLKDSKQEVDQQQIQRQNNKSKRNELINIDINSLKLSSRISTFEIKHIHIGEVDKINLKNGGMFWVRDPLFLKKMRSFDSTTLGQLMLNSFELGINLQILFFGDYNMYFDKEDKSVQRLQIEDESIQIVEWTEVFIEQFLDDEYKKLKLLVETCGMYETITHFKKVSGFSKDKLNENQLKQEQLSLFYENCLRNDSQNIFDINSHLQHNIYRLNSQECKYSTCSDKEQYQNSFTHQTYFTQHLASSEKLFDKGWLKQSQSMTMAIPWEMEFGGEKLLRKIINQSRRSKTNSNLQPKTKKSKSQNTTTLTIQFNNITEQREKILTVKQTEVVPSHEQLRSEKYIMPKNMNPMGEIIKKIKEKHSVNTQLDDSDMLGHFQMNISQQDLPFQSKFLMSQHSRLENQNKSNNINNYNSVPEQSELMISSSVLFLQNLTPNALQNIKTFGLKDIRQIKQLVFKKAISDKKIWLSDVNINLSAAATLIIFLHLANQYNMQIYARDDQADVLLSNNN